MIAPTRPASVCPVVLCPVSDTSQETPALRAQLEAALARAAAAEEDRDRQATRAAAAEEDRDRQAARAAAAEQDRDFAVKDRDFAVKDRDFAVKDRDFAVQDRDFAVLKVNTPSTSLALLNSKLVVDSDAVFRGLPELSKPAAARLLPLLALERPSPSAKEKTVQAFVARVLKRLLDALGAGQYKVVSEKAVLAQPGRPDHVVLRAREASPQRASSLVLVEDKRRDAGGETESSPLVRQGTLDAVQYAVTRVLLLRDMFPGAPAQDGWTAFCVFTNGSSVRVLRVAYAAAGGWRVHSTPLLPLFDQGTVPGSDAVPAGLAALARLLSASPQQLGDLALPPAGLTCVVDGAQVALGDRVGLGGTSDVYACEFAGQPAVVKHARIASGARRRPNLGEEAAVLRALEARGCRNVPHVLAAPKRAMEFLVLSPRGVPLLVAARACRTLRERRQLASRAASDVLVALKDAHSAGIAHCDVRPENVVVNANGTAILVDWDTAARLGALVDGPRGTLAFAAAVALPAFEPTGLHSWTAAPAVDLEPVALLYAAVADGDSDGVYTRQPWLPPHAPVAGTSAQAYAQTLLDARDTWLGEIGRRVGKRVRDFVTRVRAGEEIYEFQF